MKLSLEIERLISASLLRLRMKSTFFATLALFTRFRATQTFSTAATDGQDIFFNPEFLRSLPSA
jgi:predicted metal-dependent peptidase